MLGIGAGALGVAVAARVASAVVDTPAPVVAPMPNNEIDHETFVTTMEPVEIDWEKWLEDVENIELPKQDFRQESPPIVPSGSFNSYEWKHNYINSDLVIHSDDMKMDTIQLPLPTKDDRLDAFTFGFTGFKNTWGRNE